MLRIIFSQRRFFGRRTCDSRQYCTHKIEQEVHNESIPYDTTTHFGYKTVRREDKEELVGEVFRRVAHKYDVMNDAMSLGIHRLWKDYFIQKLSPIPGTLLLDVAGGTGDIAFRFLHHVKNSPLFVPHLAGTKVPAKSKVTVIDINPSMLAVGQDRATQQGYFPNGLGEPAIEFKLGNAEDLPVTDNEADAYTIAFGIRNCTNIDKVLLEAFRSLKPGGRFMCLEFSHVQNSLLSSFYDLYSFNVIPALGAYIVEDRDSYQYLVESIRKFPDQNKFAKMMVDAGFGFVEFENLLGGVAAIHSGFKPI